jgi:hypothetical protein
MQQTGKTPEQCIDFLNDFYNRAKTILIHQWDFEEKFPAAITDKAKHESPRQLLG